MHVVSLDHVSKSYDGLTVVDDFSLQIGLGEIVALLGPTGAGKSTILNIIMGQTGPSLGQVRVRGLDPRRNARELRGHVAVSFQSDRLLPWRTAEQNVALGLEYLGVAKAARMDRARAWLQRVKLDAVHHGKFPHQLSGGMRQRVALARAMAIDPDLILLDESFSQLDHSTSQILREDFVSLVRELKKTCLLITHRIDDAVEMADRIIVIAAPGHLKFELAVEREGADATYLAGLRERVTAELSEFVTIDADNGAG